MSNEKKLEMTVNALVRANEVLAYIIDSFGEDDFLWSEFLVRAKKVGYLETIREAKALVESLDRESA